MCAFYAGTGIKAVFQRNVMSDKWLVSHETGCIPSIKECDWVIKKKETFKTFKTFNFISFSDIRLWDEMFENQVFEIHVYKAMPKTTNIMRQELIKLTSAQSVTPVRNDF